MLSWLLDLLASVFAKVSVAARVSIGVVAVGALAYGLRVFTWLTNDAVNRLRFTRGIQDALAFQLANESFAICGVVRAFDVDLLGHNNAWSFRQALGASQS